MLLKDNLLKQILEGVESGVVLLKNGEIEKAESALRTTINLSKGLTVNDLEVSQNHINAVMKQKELDNQEDALKYILYQIRDFCLKGLLGNLMSLIILSYVEKINKIEIEEGNN